MTSYARRICVAILTFFIIGGCNRQNQSQALTESLTGSWTFAINDGVYSGIDTLCLMPDYAFRDIKSVSYNTSDSGFNISAYLSISISGRWSIKDDTIMALYEPKSLLINLNKDSFNVSARETGANTIALNKLRESMFLTLRTHIVNSITKEFKSMSGRYISLGKVEYVSNDEMVLVSHTRQFLLKRAK